VSVPVVEGKNTDNIVIEIANALNLQIKSEDISVSHRINKLNNSTKAHEPPPIIARFVNRNIRNKLYSQRKETRNLKLKSLCFNNSRQI